MREMKTLVAGWFSFVDGHATAGDLLSRDVVCHWLDQIECHYDIAVANPFTGGVDWRCADPDDYSHVLFVCGPFERSAYELDFLARFARCRLVGINLSLLEPKSTWDPFDLLLERDSPEFVRPDVAFLSPVSPVPVVGCCLVEPHAGLLVSKANEAVDRLLQSREMAIVRIDTRLDADSNNLLRTPAEIETLIARTDAVLTTRLHGLVLSLKSGIPAIAIDPAPGGAKIYRQAELLGWPLKFLVDRLDDAVLREAFQRCFTVEMRMKAHECRTRARALLHDTRDTFLAEMRGEGGMEERYLHRLAQMEEQPNPGNETQRLAQSGRRKLIGGWRELCRWLRIPHL